MIDADTRQASAALSRYPIRGHRTNEGPGEFLAEPLAWIGSSKKDLMELPIAVRKFFGHALDFPQRGDQHLAAKVLRGFGGAGVLEHVEDDTSGTYRVVYTVKFEQAVFVLHCFQKKSKAGVTTPKEHMAIIRARLKVAEAMAKEL